MHLPFFSRPHKPYVFLDLITALFVTVLIVSNIASGAKILDLTIPFFGLNLSIDGGTLMFPLSYIFSDILTEVYGYARSRRVIWTGFLCMGLTSLSLYAVQLLPGEAQWQTYAGDAAYGAILGSMSSGAIVFASLLAYFCGEFSNSFIMAKVKVWMSGKHLWMRTIGSTVVGEAIDTSAFIFLAASFQVFPWEIVPTLLLTVYLFKVAVEVLFTPVTYAIVRFLKKVENEDHYDRTTNFNPFQLGH